ncbi:hypothetical protein V495_04082 [Pseudogymnoascus sp. VKM F-4514 (FW-929)]|nr:hypothetical protein V495_04082 [Pseudogymnoascus sp. VKM F-4514 (FW-929)]
MDYANLPTPPTCVADFCLIPIGTPTASVSAEVAAVQRLMKASGLSYTMHSAGTTVEGSWDEVFRIIGQAHTLVHKNGVLRVQTDIRAGTRTDKKQHFAEKVSKVESILAADVSTKAEGASGGSHIDAEGNEGYIAGDAKVGAPAASSGTAKAAEGEGEGDSPGGTQVGPGKVKGTWASLLKK